ncbi:MAG TPA: peptide deformylase [Clostridiales bacterium]|nr:peptide deformylase [Clostridiales bacterium]
MAVYSIEKAGESSILREKAKPVKEINDTIKTLLDDMAETMYHNKGCGLAAPQVGIGRRLIVVDVGDGLIELINPVLIKGRGKQVGEEGCLSVPGFYGDVERFKTIFIEGLDRDGNAVKVKARDYTAVALQHEIDHLDGILFTDKLKKEKKE